MSDLIARLRGLAACEHDDHSIGEEAVQEIRRLTALLVVNRANAELADEREAKAATELERLRAELESHAWEISPGMAQAKIDQLNAEVERLREERDAAIRQVGAEARLRGYAESALAKAREDMRRLEGMMNSERKDVTPPTNKQEGAT